MKDDLARIEQVLPQDVLLEVILTTVSRTHEHNAAPIGIRRADAHVLAEVACGTRTVRNISETRIAVLNLIRSPLTFAQAAFNMLPISAFRPLPGHDVHILSEAAAFVVLDLQSEEDFRRVDDLGASDFRRFTFTPSRVQILAPPQPHSRRYSAAIEAIIGVTKAGLAQERGLKQPIPRMVRDIRTYIALARRTGRDAATEEALRLCEQQLASIPQEDTEDKDIWWVKDAPCSGADR